MSGIDISEADASKENLPEDLNSLAYGAYRLPDLSRRRLFAYIILFFCISSFTLSYFLQIRIFTYPGVIFLIIFVYIYSLNNQIKIDQSEVIETTAKYIDHSVGYYSVALTFNGLFLHPVWTVIIYDHNIPPSCRSIIEINANTSELIGEVYKEML